MPRPLKKRNVCQLPSYLAFGPCQSCGKKIDSVTLLIDELETIRLIDLEGYSQEEASIQMKVARTTVQRIYIDARKKLSDAIVNGKRLVIEGGEYILCDKNSESCHRPNRLCQMNYQSKEDSK